MAANGVEDKNTQEVKNKVDTGAVRSCSYQIISVC